MKLHKRICDIKLIPREDGSYNILHLGSTIGSMTVPTWELVSLWYQIGELLGFDKEDAKHELERLHWKNDQGELDEPSQKIVGRKSRKNTDVK